MAECGRMGSGSHTCNSSCALCDPYHAHLRSANPYPRANLRSSYTRCYGEIYSSSLSGAGPSAHATIHSGGRHASHMRMPGTPLRVAMALVLVRERANFQPQAVRPSDATRCTADEARFCRYALGAVCTKPAAIPTKSWLWLCIAVSNFVIWDSRIDSLDLSCVTPAAFAPGPIESEGCEEV